jgi:23S rRNA pseudouridine1911/1915/1917 synthase
MVVHPAVGNWDGTIVNALAYYLSNKSPYGPGEFLFNSSHPTDATRSEMTIQGKEGEVMAFRPGIVHRLDKGTSGVLVVAKTHQALAILSAFFARRQVQKTYLAITIGNPGKNVVIDKPIGRHPLHRQKMRVVPELSQRVMRDELHASSRKGMGRRAISHVQTLRFDSKLSVCQVRIETGRTHQIRVHLQDRKTPIYGDDIYGIPDWNKRLSKSYDIHRPLLHAHKLEINHPIHGHKMVFQAPMPKDMSLVAQSIWNDGIDERPELFTI